MTKVSAPQRPTQVKERGSSEIDRVEALPTAETGNLAAGRSLYDNSSLALHAPATVEVVPHAANGGRKALIGASMLVLIVVPFILACVYFLLIATPQYMAEARFVVRTLGEADVGPDVEGSSAGAELLGMTPLPQDAHVVTSFIHSPAMLDRLGERLDFRKIFSGAELDFWARLNHDFSREELLDYWAGQVATYLDGPSGIVTLRVRAFSPEDAMMLAQAIIEESEILINDLSARARADYVGRAAQEVAVRQENYRQALEQLNELQNETAILDPRQRATETGTLLMGLLSRKLEVDARLFVLEQQVVTDAPGVRQLRSTQAALADQIETLRGQLADAGTVSENLSRSLRRFSEVETDHMLASELYAAARRNLTRAQAQAIRKAVYVTVFVPPALAEDARYPQRIAMPLLILLGLSVIWGIAALVWASIEDHRT